MNPIIWLTGLPCSGKTTIARAIAARLNCEVLDGDELRNLISNNDFSYEGRRRHVLMAGHFAYRLSKYVPVVVALVSPVKAVRDEVKALYPNLKEIHVKAELATCIDRDVKGMYKKALAGLIPEFTGIGSPYEAPENGLCVETDKMTIDECVEAILAVL